MPRDVTRVDPSQVEFVDEAPPPAEPRSLGGFLANVPGSVGGAFGTMLAPLLHPVQTVQGLATAAAHPLMTAQAVGSELGNRYGSLEALGTTLYEDPAGAALDASLLLGGAGAALRGTGAVSRAGALGRTGRALDKASRLTNPVTAPLQAAIETAGPRLGRRMVQAGRSEMGRVAKPLRSLEERRPPGAKAFEDIMLEQNVNPTRRGQAELIARRQQVGKRIGEVASQSTRVVDDPSTIVQGVRSMLEKAVKHGDIEPQRVAKIQKVIDEFLAGPNTSELISVPDMTGKMIQIRVRKPVPISTLHELQVDLGKLLRDKRAWGRKGSAVRAEAQKELQRDIRRTTNAAEPALVPLNKLYEDLSYAIQQLRPSIRREANTHVLGPREVIGEVVGQSATGVPLLGAAASRFVNSPAGGGMLARGLYRTGKALDRRPRLPLPPGARLAAAEQRFNLPALMPSHGPTMTVTPEQVIFLDDPNP